MESAGKKLVDLLQDIKGSGAFVSFGVNTFIFPGLRIEGVGELGFPLQPIQIKEVIRVARKAPFGKGSQTITDPTVRSAWEVDTEKLSFHFKGWQKLLNQILEQVKQGLGLEDKSVTASLYKLLIYEKGDFFLPHKDSEKEKGMFGTLVIGLPAVHSGGELNVRFDGREETIDFSQPASNYQIPFAAFFADCEHEIKPIQSGYRVCLVYNLLHSGEAQETGSFRISDHIDKLTPVLEELKVTFEDSPKVVLLGHQYTPANFSLAHLKLDDRPRAEALLAAAAKAGYFALLGLVTHYQRGELEYEDYRSFQRGRSRRYWDEEETSAGGSMGEIYEEDTNVDHWLEDQIPGLGELPLSPEDILSDQELGEDDPLEKEEEGFTGNAGMTMEYWYHYGAVILWPKSLHSEILKNQSNEVKIKWLGYYINHWEEEELQPKKYTKNVLKDLAKNTLAQNEYKSIDYSPVVEALIKLGDLSFLNEHGEALLIPTFAEIQIPAWVSLLQRFKTSVFDSLFQKIGHKGEVLATNHLVKILSAGGETDLRPFVLDQIRKIPEYLVNISIQKLNQRPTVFYSDTNDERRKDLILSIVEHVLALSAYEEKNEAWMHNVFNQLIHTLPRAYVNQVLTPILLSGKYRDRQLNKQLYKVCVEDFRTRVKARPEPPQDWSREAPSGKKYQEYWELLRPFLQSPTQQVFDFVRNEIERNSLEHAIKSARIDLRTETIKKGRPYTLRLIKTMASHERAFANWKEDVELLKQLEEQ